MTGQLEGRRVVVTGAAAGIGRATAERVIKDGATVAIADISADDWSAEAAEGQARYWQLDVADPAAVSTFAASAEAWLGGVDVVIHVAGIMAGQQCDVADLDLETWDQVLDVNLRGTFLVVRAFAAALRRTKGALVLTGSYGGVIQPSGSLPYGASKAGIHGLSLTLDAMLGRDGVRVNEVLPGAVDTPLYRGSVEEALRRTGDEDLGRRLSADLGEPSGVAAIMAFLASGDADYVRGAIRTR